MHTLKKGYLHDTGMFYFTLGNLSPRLRSKLTSIHLIAIVKTTIISLYGMDAILQPLINDLKKLVGDRHLNVAHTCTHTHTHTQHLMCTQLYDTCRYYMYLCTHTYFRRKESILMCMAGHKSSMEHLLQFQQTTSVALLWVALRRAVLPTALVGIAWPLRRLLRRRYV